jgi:hypothetical protein
MCRAINRTRGAPVGTHLVHAPTRHERDVRRLMLIERRIIHAIGGAGRTIEADKLRFCVDVRGCAGDAVGELRRDRLPQARRRAAHTLIPSGVDCDEVVAERSEADTSPGVRRILHSAQAGERGVGELICLRLHRRFGWRYKRATVVAGGAAETRPGAPAHLRRLRVGDQGGSRAAARYIRSACCRASCRRS